MEEKKNFELSVGSYIVGGVESIPIGPEARRSFLSRETVKNSSVFDRFAKVHRPRVFRRSSGPADSQSFLDQKIGLSGSFPRGLARFQPDRRTFDFDPEISLHSHPVDLS